MFNASLFDYLCCLTACFLLLAKGERGKLRRGKAFGVGHTQSASDRVGIKMACVAHPGREKRFVVSKRGVHLMPTP